MHYPKNRQQKNVFAAHRPPLRVLALLVLIVALVLSACGEDTGESGETPATGVAPTAPDAPQIPAEAPDTGEPVIIGFGISEFQRQAYEPIVEAFNTEHPGIQVQIVSLDKIMNFGRRSTPDIDGIMRDIVSAADTAAPIFPVRPEDIERGYLRDLKPLMDADPNFNEDDFYPHALDPMGEDGGVYMLPERLPVPVLSYNKELWMASGLPTPTADWTWHDLTATAEQLAQKRGDTVDVYGLMLSGGSIALFSELSASGVDLFGTPLDQVNITGPEYQTAIERIRNLGDSGGLYLQLTESGVIEFNTAKAEEIVMDGRVGMWMPHQLPNRPNSPQPAFEVGTMVFPASSGDPIFYFGMPMGTIMSSGTQHPQEAWTWLEFLSRQQVDTPFMQQDRITQIPARRSIAERSGYWDDLDEETAEVVRAALDQPAPSLPAGLTGEFSDKMHILDQALSAVVSGKQTTMDALQDGQEDLNERVAELQLTPQPTVESGPIVVATLEPEPGAAAEGATEISFGTVWFGADDVRQLAKEFHEQHPDIAVTITNIGNVGSNESPEFAETASNNDCFAWLDEPEKEDFQHVLDLQPLIDADATFSLDDYPAVFLQPYRDGTGLYGLPYSANLAVLMYNQTAFDNMGVGYPTIDWTMDDLLAAAEQLDTGGNEAERQYGFAAVSTTPFVFNRFNASVTQEASDTVELDFTNPKVIEATQFYITLLQEYSPHEELPGYRQGAWSSEVFQLIGAGRVGMWLSQGGAFFGMGSNTRDFTIAVAPPPLGNSSITDDDVSMRGLHISAETSHPQACWQWIAYLSEDASLSLLQRSFPARLSLVDEAIAGEETTPGTAETFQAYQARLTSMPELAPGQSFPPEFDQFWLMQAIDRALQGENLEQELIAAEETTEQYLACVEAGEEKSTCATQVDPDYEGYNVVTEELEGEE